MRDNYHHSALFVRLHVCLLCAIECQKLPMTLESRENGGRWHSQQRNAAMHIRTTGTSNECAVRPRRCMHHVDATYDKFDNR